MTKLGLALATFGLTITMISGNARAETVEPSGLDELRAKYADSESKFMDVDGIDVHYKDQGDGPPVILLHASFLNLRAWDGLAAALEDDFRVVRFDFPTAGLTGPDTKKKESLERNGKTMGRLADALGIDSFALVATSSGAIVGTRYVAANPERITRLVLINSAGLPRTAQTDPNRLRPERKKYESMPLKPLVYWEELFDLNFIAPHQPPEWIAEMAYDTNRRQDLLDAMGRYSFSTGDPKSVLASITAPTLIMWGKENPTVVHLEADVFQHWMTGAATLVKKYPGTGHYPYLEEPELITGDVHKFLLGEMDKDLRQTTMVPLSDH